MDFSRNGRHFRNSTNAELNDSDDEGEDNAKIPLYVKILKEHEELWAGIVVAIYKARKQENSIKKTEILREFEESLGIPTDFWSRHPNVIRHSLDHFNSEVRR